MRTIDRGLVMLLSLAVLGGATAARAQQPSLAELARQTAEARKAREKSTKTYTNQDLGSGRPLTVSRAPGEKAPAAPGDAAEGKPAAADPTAARIQQLRAYVSEKQKEADRLQQRVSELNDAVLNTFSEEQRQALVKERDGVIAEVRGVQLDIAAQSKAADDLAAQPAPGPAPAAPATPAAPPKSQ